jgi:hypothetical protein
MISSVGEKIKLDVEVIDSDFDFGKIGRSGSFRQDFSLLLWNRA